MTIRNLASRREYQSCHINDLQVVVITAQELSYHEGRL